MSIATSPSRGAGRLSADPATSATLLVLAALLTLFVVFPLVVLVSRTFVQDGQLTLAPVLAVLLQPHHRAAIDKSSVSESDVV